MTDPRRAHVRVEGWQPVQLLAVLIAISYLVIGGVALLRNGNEFLGDEEVFFGLIINKTRALVYLGFGALGLIEATVSVTARAYGWLVFAGFGLLFAWGLMLRGVIPVNPFAARGNPMDLTLGDAWLHLATAIAGLLTAVLPARKALYLGAVRVIPPPAPITTSSTTGSRPTLWQAVVRGALPGRPRGPAT